MVAPQILVLIVGVRILLGERFRSLRLSARTKDSQSLKMGSTPVGTAYNFPNREFFFILNRLFFKTSVVAFGKPPINSSINPIPIEKKLYIRLFSR